LLIFKFHTVITRTPPKIKVLIFWAAANGVQRNSLDSKVCSLLQLHTKNVVGKIHQCR